MPKDYLQSMSSIEARVGLAQCSKYHDIIKHRRNISSIYREGLAGIDSIKLPPCNTGATYSHFVVRSAIAQQLKDYCLSRGVQLGELLDYYIPDMPAYRDSKRYGNDIARGFLTEVINLPVHMGVSTQDANKILELVIDCIETEGSLETESN